MRKSVVILGVVAVLSLPLGAVSDSVFDDIKRPLTRCVLRRLVVLHLTALAQDHPTVAPVAPLAALEEEGRG